METYISIIIPAFNEEKRLPRTLSKTIHFLKMKQYLSEIIVVSDGSQDATKEIANSFSQEYPNLKVLEYHPNKGKGYAVKKGMLESIGKYKLFMDADYAVPIDFLDTFISMINHKYDIVIGSRGLRQSQVTSHQPFFRELAAKTFGVIQRIILGLDRKSTRLNSSHANISYAVFCLK